MWSIRHTRGGTFVLSILIGLSLSAQAQNMKLGEVIVFTGFGPTKPPVDSNAHLLQSDRGSRKGDYMLAWTGSPNDKRPGHVPG